MGQRCARVSQYRRRIALGNDQESVYEDSGYGRLLRPGHSLRRCQLDDGSPRPRPAVPPEYFLRHLQLGTHGVHRPRRARQDEKRFSRLHAEVPAEIETKVGTAALGCPTERSTAVIRHTAPSWIELLCAPPSS